MWCTWLFVFDSTLGKAIFNLVKWVTLILNWQDGFQFVVALRRVNLCQLSPSANFTKDRSTTKETEYMGDGGDRDNKKMNDIQYTEV